MERPFIPAAGLGREGFLFHTCASSRDGKYMLHASSPKLTSLDTYQGCEIGKFQRHSEGMNHFIRCAAFSRDSRLAISDGTDQLAMIMNMSADW